MTVGISDAIREYAADTAQAYAGMHAALRRAVGDLRQERRAITAARDAARESVAREKYERLFGIEADKARADFSRVTADSRRRLSAATTSPIQAWIVDNTLATFRDESLVTLAHEPTCIADVEAVVTAQGWACGAWEPIGARMLADGLPESRQIGPGVKGGTPRP